MQDLTAAAASLLVVDYGIFLTHSRGRPGFGQRGYVRDGKDRSEQDLATGSRELPVDPARDHRITRSAEADLQEDGKLRALWPERTRVQLGEDRQSGKIKGLISHGLRGLHGLNLRNPCNPRLI